MSCFPAAVVVPFRFRKCRSEICAIRSPASRHGKRGRGMTTRRTMIRAVPKAVLCSFLTRVLSPSRPRLGRCQTTAEGRCATRISPSNQHGQGLVQPLSHDARNIVRVKTRGSSVMQNHARCYNVRFGSGGGSAVTRRTAGSKGTARRRLAGWSRSLCLCSRAFWRPRSPPKGQPPTKCHTGFPPRVRRGVPRRRRRRW